MQEAPDGQIDQARDTAYVRIEALAKRYPGQTGAAVDGVGFTLARGDMLALLGPSGCGKTTVLRMIAGLVPADAGRVLLAGRDLTAVPIHQRNIGMVFQSYALFPHMTVAENVAFGLEMKRVDRASRTLRVRQALDMVRLEGLDSRPVRRLSGGQQQRVALARALASEPDVLLLDEPLSNLDALLREEMRSEIRTLQKRLGMTTIFVTHDQDEALSMADHVAVMHGGRIVQFGTPEAVYERPADRFVAGFIGRANLLDGHVLGHDAGTHVTVEIDGIRRFSVPLHGAAPAPGTPATLVLRPHRLKLLDATTPAGPQAAHGTLESLAYRGDLLTLGVRIGAQLLRIEAPAGRSAAGTVPAVGAAVAIGWDTDAATWIGI